MITGQTYTRKVDVDILSQLGSLGASIHKVLMGFTDYFFHENDVARFVQIYVYLLIKKKSKSPLKKIKLVPVLCHIKETQ